MDISRKTDYALRMLAALVRDPSGVVSVRSAALDNGVPYSFARSIQHDLVNAGMVESLRGSKGGMRLSVDPAQVTLLEVVEAIQGPLVLASCASAGPTTAPGWRDGRAALGVPRRSCDEDIASQRIRVRLVKAVAASARPIHGLVCEPIEQHSKKCC